MSFLNYCVSSRILICRFSGSVLYLLLFYCFCTHRRLTLSHELMDRTSVSRKEQRRLVGYKGQEGLQSS